MEGGGLVQSEERKGGRLNWALPLRDWRLHWREEGRWSEDGREPLILYVGPNLLPLPTAAPCQAGKHTQNKAKTVFSILNLENLASNILEEHLGF